MSSGPRPAALLGTRHIYGGWRTEGSSVAVLWTWWVAARGAHRGVMGRQAPGRRDRGQKDGPSVKESVRLTMGFVVGLSIDAAMVAQAASDMCGCVVWRGADVAGGPVTGLATEVATGHVFRPRTGAAASVG